MNWKIRKCNLEKDVYDMTRINTECRKTNYKWVVDQWYLDSLNTESRLENRKKFMEEHPEDRYIFTDDNDNILWFINITSFPEPVGWFDFEIQAIYIDINHQWEWIWRKLFEYILSKEEYKNKNFLLRTLEWNPGSRWFYERMWGKADITGPKIYWDKEVMLIRYIRKK